MQTFEMRQLESLSFETSDGEVSITFMEGEESGTILLGLNLPPAGIIVKHLQKDRQGSRLFPRIRA